MRQTHPPDVFFGKEKNRKEPPADKDKKTLDVDKKQRFSQWKSLPLITRIAAVTGIGASGFLFLGGATTSVTEQAKVVASSPVTSAEHLVKGDLDEEALLELGWFLASLAVILQTSKAVNIGLDAKQPFMTGAHLSAILISGILAFYQAPVVLACLPFITASYQLGNGNRIRNEANPLEPLEFDLRPFFQLLSPKTVRMMMNKSSLSDQKFEALNKSLKLFDSKRADDDDLSRVQALQLAAKEFSGLFPYLGKTTQRVVNPLAPSKEIARLLKKDSKAWKKPQGAVADLASQLNLLAGLLALTSATDLIPPATPGLQIGAQATLLAASSVSSVPLFAKAIANWKYPIGKWYLAAGLFMSAGRTAPAFPQAPVVATLRGLDLHGEAAASIASVMDAEMQKTLEEALDFLKKNSDISNDAKILWSEFLRGRSNQAVNLRTSLGKRGMLALKAELDKAEQEWQKHGVPLERGLDRSVAKLNPDKQLKKLVDAIESIPEPNILMFNEQAVREAEIYLNSMNLDKKRNIGDNPNVREAMRHYQTLIRNQMTDLPQMERFRKIAQEYIKEQHEDLSKSHARLQRQRELPSLKQDQTMIYYGVLHMSRTIDAFDLYCECFVTAQDITPLLTQGKKLMHQQPGFARGLDLSKNSTDKSAEIRVKPSLARHYFSEIASMSEDPSDESWETRIQLFNKYGTKIVEITGELISLYGGLIQKDKIKVGSGDAIALRSMIQDGLDTLDILEKKLSKVYKELMTSDMHYTLGLLSYRNDFASHYEQLKSMRVDPKLFAYALG